MNLPDDSVTMTGLGLTLREWTDADLPAMTDLFDDRDVDRFTPLRAPFDMAAARTYLDTARQARAEGHRLHLAITTDGHNPQGEILLADAPDGDNTPVTATAELAYAIGRHHRRRRLAARAVELITDYAYSLAYTTVVLRIPAANTASTAVARTTGFHLTDRPPLTRGGDPLLTWRHERPIRSSRTTGNGNQSPASAVIQ